MHAMCNAIAFSIMSGVLFILYNNSNNNDNDNMLLDICMVLLLCFHQ